MNTEYKKRHHDDEFYDEVTIRVCPRYKTSGMSGDEWRVSSVLSLKRKGEVVFERSFGTVETAVKALPWFFTVAGELSDDEFDRKASERTNTLCDQPGCSNPATTKYKYKQLFTKGGDLIGEDAYFTNTISFCEKHTRRGDCGREDSDDNYEVLSGNGPEKCNFSGAEISESSQMIVNVDSVENIGKEISKAIREKGWDTTNN